MFEWLGVLFIIVNDSRTYFQACHYQLYNSNLNGVSYVLSSTLVSISPPAYGSRNSQLVVTL
jgi:hypothetical protein